MPTAIPCRHCSAPLDALALRRGAAVCDRAPCRHRAAVAHTESLKQQAAAATLAQAQAEGRADLRAVVWLQHHDPQPVPLSDDERERHRVHLQAVVADGVVIDPSTLAPDTADDSHPQGAHLCGQCRGRCCEHGAGWRAFIDLTLLQRWQQAHDGATLADAVEAYVALLPAAHVEGGCLYQTDHGCALPRERRADICNGFACPPLQQLQRLAAADAGAAVLALTWQRDRLSRAAVVDAAGTHSLHVQIGAPRGHP